MEEAGNPVRHADASAAVAELLRRAWDIPSNELSNIIEVAGDVLGADAARVLVADYGLQHPVRALGDDGPVGEAH